MDTVSTSLSESSADHKRCPYCGTWNRAQARFCDHCGRSFPLTLTGVAPSWPEAPAQSLSQADLHRFIPSELVDRWLDVGGTRAMEGERRVVTTLFCDVQGSTAAAALLDPEEWREAINSTLEQMITPVYRYEGTVARLMGDGILAFFGAPVAHENDPERAVLAGLEIVGGVESLRQQMEERFGIDLQVRVGINTGLVVVGAVGSDLRMEYTAMGDAINLAARMEQTAAPGTVKISANTYRLVHSRFDVETLDAMEMKGVEGLVPAYRVLGRKLEPGRSTLMMSQAVPLLIGRSSEMAQLERALLQVRQGRGGIVCLIGDDGVGKSRLITDLRASIAGDEQSQVRWIGASGISYDATSPYWLFRQVMRQMSGSGEGEPLEQARKKVLAYANQSMPSSARNMVRMAQMLLGIIVPAGTEQPSGETLKRQLFAEVLNTARQLALDAPLVGVFDDLHWADAASIELLIHLFQLCQEVPFLFICAFRPYQDSLAWRVKVHAETTYARNYSEIRLSAISEDESTRLIASYLQDLELPPATQRAILQKTEGNPLFVQEMINSLIADGVIVPNPQGNGWWLAKAIHEITIPDSLRALLMAKVDRLSIETRTILQLASIIGRRFSVPVLEAVADRSSHPAAQVQNHLDTLLGAGLITPVQPSSEPAYMFRNDLTWEAAYTSVLRRRRQAIHEQVAQIIEELFPDRIQEEAHRLARHFAQASRYDRALQYYIMAGDSAAQLYANVEAGEHYAQAMAMAARWGEASADQLLHIYTQRGHTLELQGQYLEALINYEAMAASSWHLPDQRIELASLVRQATLYASPTQVHDPKRSRAIATEALSLARRLGASQAEADILRSPYMTKTIIIGDGPAGLSAALFLAKNGVQTTVLGQDKTAMHYAYLHNYLGTPDISGTEFQEIARGQATGAGANLKNEMATQLEATPSGFVVTTEEGSQYPSDYVIIAEGKAAKLATALGLEKDDHGVVVDRHFRTAHPGLYVVGRATYTGRSQAIISAGQGASAAIDILSAIKGQDFRDFDEPPKNE